MSVAEHKAHAPAAGAVRVAVVTVSDSRTPDTNEGGRLVSRLARDAGFQVIDETIVRDEPADVRALLKEWLPGERIDAVLLTGGTGVSGRDATVEAVNCLIEKPIPGYGELFRALSFAEIGAAAMLSRALAGTVGNVVLFLMPGSPAGARLAMEKLIVPELSHVVGELRRHARPEHGHGAHGDHRRGG